MLRWSSPLCCNGEYFILDRVVNLRLKLLYFQVGEYCDNPEIDVFCPGVYREIEDGQ
jgi:hypothetical protein